MSLSPSADYMNFVTEIKAGLFKHKQSYSFFGRGDVSEHSIQKPGKHSKKETSFTTRRMFENEITSKFLCKKYHKNFFPPFRFIPQIEVEIL